jgi:hypothetical protein
MNGYLISGFLVLVGLRGPENYFSVGLSGHFLFLHLKCPVKEVRKVKRITSYNPGQVVEEGVELEMS